MNKGIKVVLIIAVLAVAFMYFNKSQEVDHCAGADLNDPADECATDADCSSGEICCGSPDYSDPSFCDWYNYCTPGERVYNSARDCPIN